MMNSNGWSVEKEQAKIILQHFEALKSGMLGTCRPSPKHLKLAVDLFRDQELELDMRHELGRAIMDCFTRLGNGDLLSEADEEEILRETVKLGRQITARNAEAVPQPAINQLVNPAPPPNLQEHPNNLLASGPSGQGSLGSSSLPLQSAPVLSMDSQTTSGSSSRRASEDLQIGEALQTINSIAAGSSNSHDIAGLQDALTSSSNVNKEPQTKDLEIPAQKEAVNKVIEIESSISSKVNAKEMNHADISCPRSSVIAAHTEKAITASYAPVHRSQAIVPETPTEMGTANCTKFDVSVPSKQAQSQSGHLEEILKDFETSAETDAVNKAVISSKVNADISRPRSPANDVQTKKAITASNAPVHRSQTIVPETPAEMETANASKFDASVPSKQAQLQSGHLEKILKDGGTSAQKEAANRVDGTKAIAIAKESTNNASPADHTKKATTISTAPVERAQAIVLETPAEMGTANCTKSDVSVHSEQLQSLKGYLEEILEDRETSAETDSGNKITGTIAIDALAARTKRPSTVSNAQADSDRVQEQQIEYPAEAQMGMEFEVPDMPNQVPQPQIEHPEELPEDHEVPAQREEAAVTVTKLFKPRKAPAIVCTGSEEHDKAIESAKQNLKLLDYMPIEKINFIFNPYKNEFPQIVSSPPNGPGILADLALEMDGVGIGTAEAKRRTREIRSLHEFQKKKKWIVLEEEIPRKIRKTQESANYSEPKNLVDKTDESLQPAATSDLPSRVAAMNNFHEYRHVYAYMPENEVRYLFDPSNPSFPQTVRNVPNDWEVLVRLAWKKDGTEISSEEGKRRKKELKALQTIQKTKEWINVVTIRDLDAFSSLPIDRKLFFGARKSRKLVDYREKEEEEVEEEHADDYQDAKTRPATKRHRVEDVPAPFDPELVKKVLSNLSPSAFRPRQEADERFKEVGHLSSHTNDAFYLYDKIEDSYPQECLPVPGIRFLQKEHRHLFNNQELSDDEAWKLKNKLHREQNFQMGKFIFPAKQGKRTVARSRFREILDEAEEEKHESEIKRPRVEEMEENPSNVEDEVSSEAEEEQEDHLFEE